MGSANWRKWPLSKSAPPVCQSQEKSGRLSILAGRIKDQLTAFSSDDWEKIATACGFKNFKELIAAFWADPYAPHFETSLPYYSVDHWDGIDLLAPLYEFLRSQTNKSKNTKSLLDRFLFEIAIKQTAIMTKADPKKVVSVVLKLSESNETLESGNYLLSVEDDNISAEPIDIQTIKQMGNVAYFSDQGGIQWLKLKKSSYVGEQKLSLKNAVKVLIDKAKSTFSERTVG